MVIAVAVAVGAAAGAPCRYLLDRAVQARHEQRFPWGTVLINVLGSGALGVLLGWSAGTAGPAGGQGDGLPRAVLAALGTGWCGAFTTYSTFGYETVQLAREGLARRAVANVVLSVAGGLALAALGVVVGQALSG
jgi:fluoride exporter